MKIFYGIILAGLFFNVCSIDHAWGEEAQVATGTIVVLETDQGNIELKLLPQVAPKACENFIGLVNKGYYNGTVFHRVIKGFMIQGGDPTATGMGGESFFGRPFDDEVQAGVGFDKVGILAMANAGPGTNGSQFFITVAPTPWLNMKHTIFGEVVSGYDVVEKIVGSPTTPGDKPLKEQRIVRAYIKA
jgi:peptidylprolyl isomerase